MFDFKSNFCMLRNYVAFTVSGNRNNCRAWCTRQLPSSFPCQRRESRTTSTLDRWVPRLFYLAKKSLTKKSQLVENYTQICHCQWWRDMQAVRYPCISLSSTPSQKHFHLSHHGFAQSSLQSAQVQVLLVHAGIWVSHWHHWPVEVVLLSPKYISHFVHSPHKVCSK